MTVEDWLAFEGELIILQTDQWHSLERICRADAKGIHKKFSACRTSLATDEIVGVVRELPLS